jgi:hypothetical protein
MLVATGAAFSPSVGSHLEPVFDPAKARVAREAAANRATWAHYLARFGWTHFATLSFAREARPPEARRMFEDGFIRRLARVAQGPISYFAVVEGGVHGRRCHIHALLSGLTNTPAAELRGSWRHGNADIRIYDPRRGATSYVVKSIASDPESYFVSKRWPDVRSNGCPKSSVP